MKARKLLSVSLFTSLGLVPFAISYGQAPYRQLTNIAIPGGLTGFDISWVDPANGRYYLADRGNATATPPVNPRVVVIDTEHDQYVTSVPLPAAPNGSNGVVAVPRAHELWVGMNDSTVVVIDTDAFKVKQTISTGGQGLAATPAARADELAYDPVDHIILIANDRDDPPFVTFISQKTFAVLKKVTYDGNGGNPKSTGGIEQPVWNGTTGKFYIAIPATAANSKGEIDELDPQSFTVTRVFPTACTGPAGLVLIPGQRLMTSCGDVLDIASGRVVTTVPGVGGDEIWYNPGDDKVYFGGGTDRISVPAVDAITYQPVAKLTVGQTVAAPGVSQTTHSVAADSAVNQIFVPVVGQGVQVWTNGPAPTVLNATPNPIPVTGGATFGATTITWIAGNAQNVEVHVGSPNGQLFAIGGNSGSAQTGAWVADGTTFYLQDVTGGKGLTSANTLATVVVHLSK